MGLRLFRKRSAFIVLESPNPGVRSTGEGTGTRAEPGLRLEAAQTCGLARARDACNKLGTT